MSNTSNTRLKVAGFSDDSIVDGPGIRFTLFVQGCENTCEGCHNKQAKALDGGEEITIEDVLRLVAKNPLLDGITFSGGEPFLQAAALANLAKMLRTPEFSVVTYTGYTAEYLLAADNKGWRELMENTDILIDGPFELSQKSYNVRFRGSKNQRIIDMRKTLEEGRAVVIE